MQTLSVRATIYALSVLATVFYVACALFQPLFPAWPMYEVTMWQALFPGFSWTWGGVILGLTWTLVYAGSAGLIFAGVYNFFVGRRTDLIQKSGKHTAL